MKLLLLLFIQFCIFVQISYQQCGLVIKEIREADNTKKTKKVTSCSASNMKQGKPLSVGNYEPYLQVTSKLIKYPHLYSNAFINVPNIKWLYIENIGLESVDSSSFRGLNNLLSLSLSKNKLSVMPDRNIFNDMPKLATFKMNECNIISIDDYYFSNSNLKNLYLSQNKLKSLGSAWFVGLSKLIRLDLSDNLLNNIKFENFQTLDNLEYLYLSGNKIENINKNTFSNLRKIKGLYLDNNNLKLVSEPIFDLKTLKYLDLGNNKITGLYNKWYTGLSANLVRLNLSSNAFSALIEDNMFKELKKLEKLEISPSKDKLFEVKAGILKGLDNLKYLEMGNNKVSFQFLHDIHDLKNNNLTVHLVGDIIFDAKKKWWQG